LNTETHGSTELVEEAEAVDSSRGSNDNKEFDQLVDGSDMLQVSNEECNKYRFVVQVYPSSSLFTLIL
jgi:hypothetical protein